MGSPAWDSIMLSTGLIATAFYSGKAVAYHPPPKNIPKLCQPSEEGLSLVTVLQPQISTCLSNWESCKPSDLKDFAIESKKIKQLQQEELATLWAVFAVRHDDTRYEEFQLVRECLLGALKANHIFGDELVEANGDRMDVLTGIALDCLKNKTRVALTFGIEARIAKFVSESGHRS